MRSSARRNPEPRLAGRAARLHPETGSAALEFALVGLLFVLVLYGIMEFGRFVAVYSGVQTASREAARYGSAVGDSGNVVPRYADCTEIRQVATSKSGLASLAAEDIEVTFDQGPGTGVVATCPDSGNIDPADIAFGHRIVVTATTTYDSFSPFFGDREITSTDRRTIFKP